MTQDVSTSISRRTAVAALALTTAPAGLLAGTDRVYAQAKQVTPEAKQITPEKSLYDRLGGVFAIAAVVDHFSDAVVKNPMVGRNPTRSCRMAHQEFGKVARPQVHADAVGVQRLRRAVPVRGHQARHDAARP